MKKKRLIPGSIRGKLIFTYSAVIAVFLIITVVLLNITARKYLEDALEKNLYAEASVIEELYRERTDLLINEQKQITSEDFRLLIREWFSDVRSISKLGFSSNIALVLKRDVSKYSLFTPGETSNEENFKRVNSQLIVENLRENPFFFTVMAGKTRYFSVSRPLNASQLMGGENRAWLVVYVPVNEVNQLVRELNTKAIFAILVALFWAAVFTYYFSGNFSKPIRILKEHAMRIAGRDFKSRADIQTGDEIESLAQAMNKIAGDLSDYDKAQKRLIQNMSHELKTPVMSIRGYAEGLLDDVITDKDKALNIIVDECQRLTRLVDEVMFLSKLENLEEFYRFEACSINGLLNECSERMALLAANQGLSLRLQLEKDRTLSLDHDKMLQAIINLISNALRYARKEIVVSTQYEESAILVKVEDDGQGMDEKEQSLVFERFYKGRKGVTGLGMTIVRAIVERHGGKVDAGKSELGGAIFTISLPGK